MKLLNSNMMLLFCIATVCTGQFLVGMKKIDIGVGCAGEDYNTVSEKGGRVAFHVHDPDADFIALDFSKFNLPTGDVMVLSARNMEDGLMTTQTLTGGMNLGEFTSEEFYSTNVTMELFSKNSVIQNPLAAECIGFQISAYRFSAIGAAHERGGQETICPPDDSKNAACYKYLPEVYGNAKTVIRLTIYKTIGTFYCTGWLVGCEGHVMTNEHCVSSQSDANKIKFEFMAEGNRCSSSCQKGGNCGGTVGATSSTLIAVDKGLDYALLKMKTSTDLNARYGYLQMRESGPVLNEQIYIPQHPQGWGKHIAVKNDGDFSKITTLTRSGCALNQAGYFADTQGGSSGSPVIGTKDHTVIALHHCGGCPNTGIQIHKIVASLKKKGKLPKCATPSTPDPTPAPTPAPTLAPATPKPTLAPTPAPRPAPAVLVTQGTFDGSIFHFLGKSTVDYMTISVAKKTTVEFDLLSGESVDYRTFQDVNSDCDASFIDSAVMLFRKGSTESLQDATYVGENDDAGIVLGKRDGSISSRDSYLKVTLNPGKYILAIGTHPLNKADAIMGQNYPVAETSVFPFTCDQQNSDHGNYRVTVRSSRGISMQEPGTYVGNQCSNEPIDPSSLNEKCPYHATPQELQFSSEFDATIYRNEDGTASVDYVHFTLPSPSLVEFDILSMETLDYRSFTDVNGDCDASYIDSAMVLFQKTSDGPLDSSKDTLLVAFNDDDSGKRGFNDGSIHIRDSYLKMFLQSGEYVMAISRNPLNATHAIEGSSPAGPYTTPFECDNLDAMRGNYQLSIRSDIEITNMEHPTSAQGTDCSNVVVTPMPPMYPICSYHSPVLPLKQVAQFDGSIVVVGNDVSTSIDYVKFTLSYTSTVELDILSVETKDSKTFQDVNGDCDASFIDSIIILFDTTGGKPLSKETMIFTNDDSAVDEGTADGSISKRDAFLKTQLPPGSYVAAIGKYPMPVEHAILGVSVSTTRSNLYLCNSDNSHDHGNYRVTLRSTQPVQDVDGPSSYTGNRCSNPTMGTTSSHPECPHHLEMITPKAIAPGTIKRSSTGITVDHISFSIPSKSTVVVNVLSSEFDEENKDFTDVRKDCVSAYIDSVVYVFRDVNEDGVLDPAYVIDYSDDDKLYKTRFLQRSISVKDSYLEMELLPGKYIVAIGRFPLSIAEAVQGKSQTKLGSDTPSSCGAPSDFGHYQVMFMSTNALTATSAKTFTGNQCNRGTNNGPICQ